MEIKLEGCDKITKFNNNCKIFKFHKNYQLQLETRTKGLMWLGLRDWPSIICNHFNTKTRPMLLQ